MALNKVAKKWVKALRSGKYKQGTGTLLTANGRHCCLGVLTDLAVQAGVIKEFPVGAGSLSGKVIQWSGVKTYFGQYIDGRGHQKNLASQNDGIVGRSLPKSFKQIAKIIESQPEGLFVEAK
jgi:hypothetical protein